MRPSAPPDPPRFLPLRRTEARGWGPAALLSALLVASAITPIVLLAAHPLPIPGLNSATSAPAFGPRSAGAHPSSTDVDPFALIQHEPAPMGIADFGVTAATGVVQAYSYSTPVFQGNEIGRAH